MKPLRCLDKTRTCKGRYCSGAYLFPKDDSKTTACTDTNTDWEVEFCPSGSHIDLSGRGLTSQTPPCKGGPNPSPPAGQKANPVPPPPKTSSPAPKKSSPPPKPAPKSTAPSHCSQPCEIGGFAGKCTSNCPPCYVPAGSGWNCFGKDGSGKCPNWAGMTDCSAARAQSDESATFNGQSSPANSNSIIIGLSVGIVVLVVALVVVVLIAVSNARKSNVETV